MRQILAGLYSFFIDGQGHRGPENNLIAYAPDADEHAVNAETRRPREADLATPRGLTTAASSQERETQELERGADHREATADRDPDGAGQEPGAGLQGGRVLRTELLSLTPGVRRGRC